VIPDSCRSVVARMRRAYHADSDVVADAELTALAAELDRAPVKELIFDIPACRRPGPRSEAARASCGAPGGVSHRIRIEPTLSPLVERRGCAAERLPSHSGGAHLIDEQDQGLFAHAGPWRRSAPRHTAFAASRRFLRSSNLTDLTP